MNYLKISCFLIFALVCTRSADACFAVPEAQRVPYQELIGRSSEIALMTLKSQKPTSKKLGKNGDDVEIDYAFDVVETLKGKIDGVIKIEGESLHKNGSSTFNNHKDPEFWENSSGRGRTRSNCQLTAGFKVGVKYLIFVTKPYHVKSFEQIDSGDDKWLKTVREEIAKNQKK